MTPSLSSLAQRMARVADRVREGGGGCDCGGRPKVYRVSRLWSGQPRPAHPPQGAPTQCVCGAGVEYVHIVNQYDPGDGRMGALEADTLTGPAGVIDALARRLGLSVAPRPQGYAGGHDAIRVGGH